MVTVSPRSLESAATCHAQIACASGLRMLYAAMNAKDDSTYDRSAPRKATNLSVNSDLLRLARELGLNLSRELEARLEEVVAAELRRRWIEENAASIDAYNASIERSGVFSDGLRTF